jgi:hypothetical protein
MPALTLGWEATASTAVVISVLIAGIALGVGKGFSLRRLEVFGMEELAQSIVSAAILGSAIFLATAVTDVATEFSPHLESCAASTPVDILACGMNSTLQSSSSLISGSLRVQNNIAYYENLGLSMGNLSMRPMTGLAQPASHISVSTEAIYLSSMFLFAAREFTAFVSSSWFAIAFGAGLVLRSLFLTRRVGAYLIALGISFIVFYPLSFLMLSQLPPPALAQANAAITSFLSNPAYAAVPMTELNADAALSQKLHALAFSPSGNDYAGDISQIAWLLAGAAGTMLFMCVVSPIASFLVTAMFALELSKTLAGEIAIPMSSI